MTSGFRTAAFLAALPCALWTVMQGPAWQLTGFLALVGIGCNLRATSWWSRAAWMAGAGILALAFWATAPYALALAILGTGLVLQSALPGGRPMLALGSWALVVVAATLAVSGRPALDALLVAVPGLGLLALQASWSPWAKQRAWDAVLMAAIAVASALVAVAFGAGRGWIGLDLQPAIPLALCAAAAVLALTCPLPAPNLFRLRGPAATVSSHGVVALALLNVSFLALTLLDRWSLKAILAALLLWQLAVLVLEYRAVLHAAKRLRQPRPVPAVALEPVTVVVPACNDAACLAESLAHNLAVDAPLRFVVVPAVKSADDTVAVAERFARSHPRRVQVVMGDTGSKAEDLNKAWQVVKTDAILLLDADETVDADSLRHGLQALRSDPGIGVVQGRKVSRSPDDGFLSRFVSAERRYSTWLDHVMHADHLGSAHFGGSAALVRREVPPAIGGWTERTLTEDIEFTMRVHLDGRWRIAYHDAFVVREADPRTVADLLRQRTRWSRGWAQNVDLFLLPVLKSRRMLGWRRAFGLALLLLIAVSALWTTFLPATLLMRLGGVSPLLPFIVAVPMSLILLPSRLLAYGFAALRDPVIPLRPTAGRVAELALHAYLWILVGWLVQLHALYLELSRSTREWHVTGKRSALEPTRASVPGLP